ncbi:hypothetical protein EXIGLDRAFT_702308 [Exidia glandulosa HHB12029]|uniref:Uncharacterized protein n=1 Tax=Exidia glandulosa HHB12029 TaxID=1314781 RepID=A0A165ZGX6_EXIGL|nr:hypothetical protein EXIGLDRAFT_702308 [Exidia glandulosa HHB12029]
MSRQHYEGPTRRKRVGVRWTPARARIASACPSYTTRDGGPTSPKDYRRYVCVGGPQTWPPAKRYCLPWPVVKIERSVQNFVASRDGRRDGLIRMPRRPRSTVKQSYIFQHPQDVRPLRLSRQQFISRADEEVDIDVEGIQGSSVFARGTKPSKRSMAARMYVDVAATWTCEVITPKTTPSDENLAVERSKIEGCANVRGCRAGAVSPQDDAFRPYLFASGKEKGVADLWQPRGRAHCEHGVAACRSRRPDTMDNNTSQQREGLADLDYGAGV